ncbi:MAG: ABC transporter ATP-binding protein [Ammonifex sp.]|jgi:NitT/TauT family transport system ATP-binding protein|nr:MAG: ABC transporter ATP-binding protein [Ammonifex sp.]
MILVENLKVTFKTPSTDIEALGGVSFRVEAGEICAVIGPSGCGKSTLLYVLAGLLAGFEGKAVVNGEPVKRGRRKTALILQDYGLLPWRNVFENAALGLELRGLPRSEQVAKVAPILDELGLREMQRLYPAQLSGGQRQRVAIARVLALNPDLLLMDEPFSSLDALTRETLQDNVLEIWRRTGCTVVLVTHSIEEATFLGRQVVVLSPRPGQVVATCKNAGAGETSWRRDPQFHKVCSFLREQLAGGTG